MKKLFYVLSFCLFFTEIMFAQLKVSSNGNVGIQLGTNTPLSPLSIGGVGSTDYKVNVDASNYIGLNVNNIGSSNSYIIGLMGTSSVLAGKNSYGVRGMCTSSTVQTSGKAFGVYGIAGNSTSGYNYAVAGSLTGSANGASILGLVSNSNGLNVPGRYAGYFGGDVYVTGQLG